jgi:hypothetical protein
VVEQVCEGGYTTYASTPEKAYNDWLVKEKAEPYHLYSKRSMKELMERLDKHKETNPEMYEKKIYSGIPSVPKPSEPINREVAVGTWVPKWFSELFGGDV